MKKAASIQLEAAFLLKANYNKLELLKASFDNNYNRHSKYIDRI